MGVLLTSSSARLFGLGVIDLETLPFDQCRKDHVNDLEKISSHD